MAPAYCFGRERGDHRGRYPPNLGHSLQRIPHLEELLEPDREGVGQPADLRTASRTPGMKERRSIESWRTLERLPLAAEDDFLVGDEAGQPHRVDRLVDVPPAASISSAVRFAVPEGASSFLS